MDIIKIGIIGYGNLGRGAVKAIRQYSDLKLTAVFTRRDPSDLQTAEQNVPFLPLETAGKYVEDIDVMILCGGSATDLPLHGPYYAGLFNTVDSYDTHARIPKYFAAVNESALAGKKTAAISIGWDPGLFSLFRMMGEAILPLGKEYTFWGEGVSQGHSEAIRKVTGVRKAIQYTIPVEKSLEKVRNGDEPALSPREKHIRQCFVVPEAGADREIISHAIKSMPDYFADYDTRIAFITEEEFARDHTRMPHGGFVIRSGRTGSGNAENKQIMELSLKLESNPEFTSSILIAYVRAVYRLNKKGEIGAKTILDIPPIYLSDAPPEELRRRLL